jgi:hypothetical protein
MFADPQSISTDGGSTTVSFPRTNLGPGSGQFTGPNGDYVASVRQTSSRSSRLRREIRITQDKLSADPLNPAVNVPKSVSAYLVLDQPLVGFTHTELSNLIVDLTDWLTSVSTQFINGEF